MDNNVEKNFNNNTPVFVDTVSEYGSQTQAVPKPTQAIDIDTDKKIVDNIVAAGESGQVDFSQIQEFTRISQDRNSIYDLIDTMAEDPTIAAALEIYAEDATETNDKGQIIWAESDDANVSKFVNYLLDSMNVNKNIYTWVYSLIKYGDCYLKLFKNSEFDNDGLFGDKSDKTLNEDVIIKTYKDSDKYVHYVEMVPNPAGMFELTKFGKSYAYISAPVRASLQKKDSALDTAFQTYKYQFKLNDVELYDATNFVHAALIDSQNRFPEEVSIFRGDSESESSALTYNVKRGQSILYNSFKIWREMMLLENALLLNRLTKSSLLRVFNVEVADMPKEQIPVHLQKIKQLIEQKSAINVGDSLSEYTNPGAMENNIYVPVHNQVGSISTQEIGGNPDSKGLDDVDFFKNKLYSSLKIPKQFLGDTDDAAGFNGGTSLTIISSRYAKTVKRIQNTICQALTDVIKLLLIDKDMSDYIGKFNLKMVEPVTQEQKDRQENLSTKIQSIRDIVDLLQAMQDPIKQLRALKLMLSNVIEDPEVIDILQEQIDELTAQSKQQESQSEEDEIPEGGELPSGAGFAGGGNGMSSGGSDFEDLPDFSDTEEVGSLPNPSELGGIDFTDNSMGAEEEQ